MKEDNNQTKDIEEEILTEGEEEIYQVIKLFLRPDKHPTKKQVKNMIDMFKEKGELQERKRILEKIKVSKECLFTKKEILKEIEGEK